VGALLVYGKKPFLFNLTLHITHTHINLSLIKHTDITRQSSFQNVQHWLKELRDNADPNIVIMLVGNKLDLESSSRQVTTEQGGALAETEGFLFIETSALDATNVEKAFETVFDTIYTNLPKKNKAQEAQGGGGGLTQGERIQLRPPSVKSMSRDNARAEKQAGAGGCC
jgi:Ras-related protein Rab-11A